MLASHHGEPTAGPLPTHHPGAASGRRAARTPRPRWVVKVDAAALVAPKKGSIWAMAAETRITSKVPVRLEHEHV